MSVANHEDFLTLLAQCQLLAAGPFSEVCSLPPEEPLRFADVLVERGYLTRWQADQLLAGNHQLLIGGYKLLQKIGEGGMGTVFKAQHARTTRVVALKLMSEKGSKQPQSLKRFQREIRTSAALDHPHIVSAFDADHVGDLHFLVMEYVVGHDLRTWLREHRDIPISWACECIAQAAEGLEHAHQQGLVHRDIKPGNLMVVGEDFSTRPFVKILDLGLARLVEPAATDLEQLTKTGHVLGTIDYIAPEQVANTRTVDIRGDIFALGCTLFKALTAHPPFPGRNVAEKVLARMQGDAPRASSFRPEIPPGLDAVLAKMLAREPGERYQSPAGVVAALAPFRMQAPAPVAQKHAVDPVPEHGTPVAASTSPAPPPGAREPQPAVLPPIPQASPQPAPQQPQPVSPQSSKGGKGSTIISSSSSPTVVGTQETIAAAILAYQARIAALENTVDVLTRRVIALESAQSASAQASAQSARPTPPPAPPAPPTPPPIALAPPIVPTSAPARTRWTRRS